MSFTMNKPTVEGMPQNAGRPLSRGGTSAAAFKPQIVRSVRMHPLLASAVAAVVFVTLVGYALLQKQIYQAISQVYEEPAAARLLSDSSSGVFDPNKYETFLSEQIQLVQRLDVLTAAVKSLPQSTWAEYGGTPQHAAETLQQQLKVVRIGSSYQISISLKGTDPRNTADLVNAVTTAYLAAVRKATAQDSDERAQLLAEERQRVEAELSAARAEQAVLGASIGVANPTGEGGNPYDAQLSGIRAQLTEARAAHDMAAAQLAALSGLSPARTSGLTAAADEVIAGDPGLGSMKASISARKAQLSEQMSGMTPTNPVYKQDQDELAELDKSLDVMTVDLRAKAARRLQDKLRSDLERTGDVEARLNGELSRQIATATSAAPKLQRASELGGDIQRLMLREAAVDDALRGLRLEANAPSQVRLSLAATAPESPEANRRKLLLLAALPLAMLAGAFAAVFARRQDRKIYSGLDIDEVVGFPPLTVLPARGDVSEPVFEEYVLRLAAGVESAYRTSGARTFLLTAVSLTTDIEPLTTALVRKFGEIGVNAVLATAEEMLTPVQGSATAPDAEPGLGLQLGSEGFVAANMARMKAEHGLVLIESQALANCAQTEYVARCADATILLIECGVTTREELFRAGELLERLNVKGIGTVLGELQLRFADGEFRKAIEALDRRQAGREQAGRARPASQVVARTPWVVEMPEAAAPAVETVATAAMEHEVSAPQAVVETEMEAPVEVVAETEAPVEVETELEAPIEVVAEAAPEVTPRLAEVLPMPLELVEEEAVEPVVEVAPAALRRAPGPVLVSSEPLSVRTHEDKFEEERVIAVANGTMHEKMAPKLTARRGAIPPDGDVRMARRTSWIHRLLGHEEEPVVSIIPAADDEHEAETSTGEPAHTPEAANGDWSSEDYDIPLAARLNQISGQRPIAPSEPSARLSIVPQEAEEDLEAVDEWPSALAPEPARFAESKAEVASAETQPEETLAVEPEIAVEAEMALAPEPVRPRRPLSFFELAEMAQRSQPLAAGPRFEIAEDYSIPAPQVVEHIAAPLTEVPAEFGVPVGIEPETEEAVLAEELAVAPAALAEPTVVAEPSGIHEVVRQEEPEAYAAEPAYQEAPQSLGTGRWDPIPPLRPASESWRDRPSPVPAYADRLRRTEAKDGGKTPSRWVPEPAARQPDPQPEPMLTRQWGLLSRFQQARISSSRAVAEAEPEPERDEVGPGSSSGNGKH